MMKIAKGTIIAASTSIAPRESSLLVGQAAEAPHMQNPLVERTQCSTETIFKRETRPPTPLPLTGFEYRTASDAGQTRSPTTASSIASGEGTVSPRLCYVDLNASGAMPGREPRLIAPPLKILKPIKFIEYSPRNTAFRQCAPPKMREFPEKNHEPVAHLR